MGGESQVGLSSVQLVKAVLVLAVRKEMIHTESNERDGRVVPARPAVLPEAVRDFHPSLRESYGIVLKLSHRCSLSHPFAIKYPLIIRRGTR
jgi:hypothetical protein